MSKKVFVIHGWTYNLDKWQKLIPLLNKQGLEAVMLKVPGLTTASDKVWDIDGYIKWLDEQLKSEIKPIVIGHSNGGRIALAYLQKYPDRFKQLILIDSAGLAHTGVARRTKLATLKTVSKVGKPLAKIPVVRKGFYKVIKAQDYNQAPENMRKTMQNMLSADFSIDLSKIKLPTTLIWGSDDTATPLKDGKKMHQLLKDSTLHVIKGARHAPQDTNPEQVAKIISETVER